MSRSVAAEVADAYCIHIGDDIVFLGRPHRIVKVEPYTHPDGWQGQIAHDEYGWSITLPPHSARCIFPSKPERLAVSA